MTYPELYAAVGVHSGLPYACAHDLPSAFAAMNGASAADRRDRPMRAKRPVCNAAPAVPTIIFHGDDDATVNPSNADAIVEQIRAGRSDDAALHSTVYHGTTRWALAYTRTVLADGAQQPVIEQWVLRGARHAWSGGSPRARSQTRAGPTPRPR
jgi:poly(3-hydroxybutyrate) depolymerase